MPEITAAAVKALRERTGLPMMECKRALQEAGGDEEGAIEWLQKRGQKVMGDRAGRETSSGRLAIYSDPDAGVAAMVELLCESAPVAANDEFIALASDLARQLATGPGASTPDELLAQPSPSKPGQTLKQQFDDLNNRIREVFRLNRIVRIDAPCGSYLHHDGAKGVLLEVEGGTADLAKDVCMHVVSMRPQACSKDDLAAAVVAKHREIEKERARQEGKPENIIEKMIDGRMRNFYAERCLLEQPFIKGESDKDTVGKVAKAAGMKILRFVHWEVGKE